MKVTVFLCVLFNIGSCFGSASGTPVDSTKTVDNKTEMETSVSQDTSARNIQVSVAKKMYHAARRYEIQTIRKLLKDSASPNVCAGEAWLDSTPLASALYGFYSTYYRYKNNENIPEPCPDVRTVNLLINAGADVNSRPYVWQRVYLINNRTLEAVIRRAKMSGLTRGSSQMNERIEYYLRDSNRLIEALIKSGADPDKKGHPYPYDIEQNRGKMTDEEANKYFARGTRPINEAIKKGIMWESQVDLLLKYTKLDEDSLKAAKDSGDARMVEKIDKLWKEQKGK